MNRRGKSGATFEERVKGVIGKLGENVRVVGLARLTSARGRVGSYLHFNEKTGALAALSLPGAAAAPAALDESLKNLCMHVTAARPRWLARAEVPAEALQREKDVLRESEDVKKKPAEMQEKILQGRLEKFYADHVLPEQVWTLDPGLKVGKALQQALGAAPTLEGFAHFAIGG
jgi:elongation factor Ts